MKALVRQLNINGFQISRYCLFSCDHTHDKRCGLIDRWSLCNCLVSCIYYISSSFKKIENQFLFKRAAATIFLMDLNQKLIRSSKIPREPP